MHKPCVRIALCTLGRYSHIHLYLDIADAVLARRDGVEADPLSNLFPTVEDGVLGVMFVDAAAASHQRDSRWVDAIVDVQ